MKATKFIVEQSCHQMPCIQAHDLSLEQCETIRGIICNNYSLGEDYKITRPASPFLQGYQPPCSYEDRETGELKQHQDGWILVEFWSQNQNAIQAVCDYINQRLGFISASEK